MFGTLNRMSVWGVIQVASMLSSMGMIARATEAEQQLAGSLGIMSIPTLMVFRDGIQLFSQPGALPKSALDDLVRQVREIDMVEVRKELAEQAVSEDA